MKLLFAIPHYFNADGGGRHGSLARDPRPRIAALTACVSSIRQTFGNAQHSLNIQRKVAEPANQGLQHHAEIVVCTTQDRHILGQVPLPAGSITYEPTQAEPMLLGFECQRVLRERLGQFDMYCYLEDDLIIHDPWFFAKLRWFNQMLGTSCLLQPNRYEVAIQGPSLKVYVDGDIRPQATARFQNRADQPELAGKVMETPVRFLRPANPHSGCYFLTSEQMAHWVSQPYFLDRDTSFIGPLESAATLGIMRTFRIYKPALENASFLEIQHHGVGFLSLVGRTIPLVVSRPGAEVRELAAGPLTIHGHDPAVAQQEWERITGFFSVAEALAIQSLVRGLPPGCLAVELGTFQGRSAVAIASVLPEGGRLHCVDTFEGSLLKPGETRPSREEAVARNLGALQGNLSRFSLHERVEVHVSRTQDAASQFAPGSIDLLFVDAGHDYESVRNDLQTWYPLLKPGGWLCCDDYEPNWPGVVRAIDETRWPGQLFAPSLWCHQKPQNSP